MPKDSLPARVFLPLARISAEATGPEPIFSAVEAFCERHFGFMLLTILRYLPETGEIERVHSSNPDVYPIGGRKPMGDTPWGDVVLKSGKSWLGNGAEEMRWAYPDADLSLSMGRESSFCVPVRHAGRTLGVLNMSDRRDAFDPDDAEFYGIAAGFLVPAFLMAP